MVYPWVLSPILILMKEVNNKKGVVVETSTHSMNGRYGGSAMGTKLSAHGTPTTRFSCKTHADMSSCLTEECLHSLIQWVPTGSFECTDPIMLLVVATFFSIYIQF
jgi:hypothetical protein